MNSEKNGQSKCPLVLLVLAFALMIAVGCQSTVTPRVVKSPVASWDQGGQNSGLLYWTNVGTVSYAVVTPHLRARYNGLIELYGTNFIPRLQVDQGICTNCIPGLILMDEQSCEHMSRMNRWLKSDAR